MFTKILVPSDGSVLGSISALEGVKTAAKLGAEVVGIYVSREYQNPSFGQINAAAKAEYEATAKATAEGILKPMEEAAAKAGVKFTAIHRVANHAALTIVRAAKENACDMIFIGSNGCAGWDHILMGSVSNKVLATAEVPVLVYRLKKEDVPVDTPNYYEGVFPPA